MNGMIHGIAVISGLVGLAWFTWRTFWHPVLMTPQPKAEPDPYGPYDRRTLGGL